MEYPKTISEWVAKAQHGDLRAFDEIVRRLQDLAFAVAYARLGDRQLAEDTAQEAFVEAYRGLPRLQSPEAFVSWFRRILSRQCERAVRRKVHPTIPLDAIEEYADGSRDPQQGAELRERDAAILGLLESLREHERIVVVLFYLHEYELAEISEHLGIKVTTVKQRLHVARKRLRERAETMLEDAMEGMRPSNNDRFAAGVRLMNAAVAGDISVVRELLEHDPGLAHQRQEAYLSRSTPLHAAVTSGNPEVVAALLDAGADVMTHAGDRMTPLHWAAERGDLEVVRLLVDRGADVNMIDEVHGLSPLGWATVFREVHPEVAEYLIDRGAEWDIFSAVVLGREDVVRRLVESDAAVLRKVAPTGGGRTPLLLARAKKLKGMVVLLEDLGTQSGQEVAADACLEASAAIESDDVEWLASLLQRQPDLLDRLGAGELPPLVLAACSGSTRAMQLLLDRGVDIEQVDPGHLNTALGWAAFSGQLAAASFLVAAGANLNHRNRYGGRPLETAIAGANGENLQWNGPSDLTLYPPIVELLRQAGAEE